MPNRRDLTGEHTAATSGLPSAVGAARVPGSRIRAVGAAAAVELEPEAEPSLGPGEGEAIFELLVAALQAYVFTFLAAVYIQLALADEH